MNEWWQTTYVKGVKVKWKVDWMCLVYQPIYKYSVLFCKCQYHPYILNAISSSGSNNLCKFAWNPNQTTADDAMREMNWMGYDVHKIKLSKSNTGDTWYISYAN